MAMISQLPSLHTATSRLLASPYVLLPSLKNLPLLLSYFSVFALVGDDFIRSFMNDRQSLTLGLQFYQVKVQTQTQSWRLLRRYAWFLALSNRLLADSISLHHPVPIQTFWTTAWSALNDEAHVARERAHILQNFINELIEKELYEKVCSLLGWSLTLAQKEYVASFFLPVRRLVKQYYDTQSAFGLQNIGRFLPFIGAIFDSQSYPSSSFLSRRPFC